MPDLREQLERCFHGRVCLVGLGNVDYGDDAFGVRLAEALADSDRNRVESSIDSSKLALSSAPGARWQDAAPPGGTSKRRWPICDPAGCQPALREAVIIAGTTPERLIGRVADENFDHVIFLDAVDFGGPPGAAVFLNTDEMVARFPQVSTHKLSLGLLAKRAEANGRTKACLLGVQPESLKPADALTPAVQTTLELLRQLLSNRSVGAENEREKHGDANACAPVAKETGMMV